MVLSHDLVTDLRGSPFCVRLALAKRRHQQGYDAVKLAAAYGNPGFV